MSTITRSPEIKAPDAGRHRAGKPEKPARPTKEAKAPRARRERRPVARLVVLGILVAVAIASAVVAFFMHRSSSDTRSLRAVESARQEAVAAAAQDVPKILGYDYRHLSADIAAAKVLATGQFLSDYTATAQKVLASAPSVKAIVTASVADQSVVQAQSDRVTLLLFVDQESVKQLSGQKTATTRIDPFRVQVTMSKVHGHWMVSDLEPI
jgi:Mce-associated membrane protein